MQWRRGFFRVWLVFSLLWSGASGFFLIPEAWARVNLLWEVGPAKTEKLIGKHTDCFEQASKEELRLEVQLAKALAKAKEQPTDLLANNDPELGKRRKLEDDLAEAKDRKTSCETKLLDSKELQRRICDAPAFIASRFGWIFGPPLSLLAARFIVTWIIRGFRPT